MTMSGTLEVCLAGKMQAGTKSDSVAAMVERFMNKTKCRLYHNTSITD